MTAHATQAPTHTRTHRDSGGMFKKGRVQIMMYRAEVEILAALSTKSSVF
jgi:hypothetical protein